MPTTLNIYTQPSEGFNGYLYITEVETDDAEDTNDLRVFFAFRENVDFSLLDVTLTAEAENGDDLSDAIAFIGDLSGENSVYSAVVRPPSGGGDGSFTIAVADPAAIRTVTYSDAFPTAQWDRVFSTQTEYDEIVSVTSDSVYLRDGDTIDIFDHQGDSQGEQTLSKTGPTLRLDNDSYLILSGLKLYLQRGGVTQWESESIFASNKEAWALTGTNGRLVTADNLDLHALPIERVHAAIASNDDLTGLMPDEVSLDDGEYDALENTRRLASCLNDLYVAPVVNADHYIYGYDADGDLVPERRIPVSDGERTLSIFCFKDFLYRYTDEENLYRIDLRTFTRPTPLGKVHPLEIKAGQRLDLWKFIKQATHILFEEGFDTPDWLSMEEDRYLRVADGTIADSTAYIRLHGINAHGGSEPFAFYLIVTEPESPIWKNITDLTIYAHQTLNLFEYVEGADFIDWVYNFTVPSHVAMTEGEIRVTDPNVSAEEVATLQVRAGTFSGYFADVEFSVRVLSEQEILTIAQEKGYQVFIEGIDVTAYIPRARAPQTSRDLDWVRLNELRQGRCTVPLSNTEENAGLFSGANPDSFWVTNNLNPNGYLNSIDVFAISLKPDAVDPNTDVEVSVLIFKGVILESNENIADAEIRLNCADDSYLLQQVNLSDMPIGVPKTVEMLPTDDITETVAEGQYAVEQTLGTVIPVETEAFAHTQRLTLKEVSNLPEGVTEDNTAFMTNTGIQTQGGYLADPLLAKTRTPHRYLSLRAAVEKLTKLPNQMLSADTEALESSGDAHIRVGGHLAFGTERGRLTRTPVDWLYDETHQRIYSLLTCPVDYIGDQLTCLDLTRDVAKVVYTFEPDVQVLSLSSEDFDTFIVMATEKADVDRSREPAPIDPQRVRHGYDASLSTNSKILRYKHSDRRLDTLIDTDTDFRPQPALHYWVGVSGYDFLWQGIALGNLSPLRHHAGDLFYRYATDTEFGIAKHAADGTLSAVFTEEKDAYQNHLNFAFDVDAEGNIYWAFVRGTTDSAKIVIQRDVSGTVETLYQRTLRFDKLTVLGDTQSAWLGVQNLLVHGNNIYLIVPVARGARDISTSAGSALYRYNLTTKNLIALQTSDFVQFGGSLLAEDGDAAYVIESPSVAYLFDARNRYLASYDPETNTNRTPDAKGFLKRIGLRGTENLGNIYFEEQAYRGAVPMRVLNFDDGLHFVMGYGVAERILQPHSDASRPDNFLWLTFSENIRYLSRVLPHSGTVLDALTTLAATSNTTLSIDRNILSLQNRSPRGALLDGDITPTATTLTYTTANYAFPETGFLLIGTELIAYTSRTDTALSGLTRGYLATDTAAHTDGDLIIFIDKPIQEKGVPLGSEPYLDVTVSIDSNHVYNKITEQTGKVAATDTESIATYGENPLQLPTDSGVHELPYSEFSEKQYLNRFKDLAYIINATVNVFYALNLGDIVCFKFLRETPTVEGYLLSMQVMSISHENGTTRIRGRAVKPLIEAEVEFMVDPTETFRTTDGAGNAFFADGAGNVVIWLGDERNRNPEPFFEETSLTALTFKQYTRVVSDPLPTAESPLGLPIDYELSDLTDGLRFDPQTLRILGTPDDPESAYTATYTARDSEGNTATLSQQITVTAATVERKRTTDGAGDAFFADGAGNVVIWTGS